MREISKSQLLKFVFLAFFLIGLVTVGDIYISNFETTSWWYILSRLFFLIMPFIIFLIKPITIKNKLLMIFYLYYGYTALYSILLDNSYFFTLIQILLATLFFFYYDKKYFNLSFWPGVIVCYISLFFSKEMEILKNGETFIPDQFIIVLIFCILVYFIQKKIASEQLIEMEKIERLAKVGVQSSFFMHEIKNKIKTGEDMKDILDVFYDNKNEIKEINCYEFFNHEIQKIQESLISYKIEIYNNLDKNLTINFNGNHFLIIVQNLLRNAVEEMLSKKLSGSITIWDKEGELFISNPVNRLIETTKVFSTFYTSKANGTNKGLGLSIVKDFAQKNNFYPEAKCKNNLFTISLRNKK